MVFDPSNPQTETPETCEPHELDIQHKAFWPVYTAASPLRHPRPNTPIRIQLNERRVISPGISTVGSANVNLGFAVSIGTYCMVFLVLYGAAGVRGYVNGASV